jgi:hypothetical protein
MHPHVHTHTLTHTHLHAHICTHTHTLKGKQARTYLQEMGDALLGGIYPVALDLARQHVAKTHKSTTDRVVYFDVLAYFMVCTLTCWLTSWYVCGCLR